MVVKRLLDKYVFEVDASKPLADSLQELIDYYEELLREQYREYADNELEIIYSVNKIDELSIYEFQYEIYTVSESLAAFNKKLMRSTRISIKHDDTFDITKAKELLYSGYAIARKVWLNKQYIFLITASSSISIYPEYEHADAWGSQQDPYLVMRHLDLEEANKSTSAIYTTGYQLSGDDLFAEDWFVVKSPSDIINNELENSNTHKGDNNV